MFRCHRLTVASRGEQSEYKYKCQYVTSYSSLCQPFCRASSQSDTRRPCHREVVNVRDSSYHALFTYHPNLQDKMYGQHEHPTHESTNQQHACDGPTTAIHTDKSVILPTCPTATQHLFCQPVIGLLPVIQCMNDATRCVPSE